jgi:carboxypeptidase Taq
MAWDDAYQKALGIRPQNHQEGILQDIHWSLGYFGYFPSYTLGNLYSASYKKHLKTVLPNIDSQNRNGTFSEVLTWLRTNIHQKGSLSTQEDIVKQAVGEQDHVRNLIEHFQERQTLAHALRERI